MDRRAAFFAAAAVVCVALVPVSGDFGWVAAIVAAVYALLALASWLDHRSRRDR
jgi:cyanate permease